MDTVRLSLILLFESSSELELTRLSFRLSPAIRLAFELDLHLEHKRPLPEDDLDALKVLVRPSSPCLCLTIFPKPRLESTRLSDLTRPSLSLLSPLLPPSSRLGSLFTRPTPTGPRTNLVPTRLLRSNHLGSTEPSSDDSTRVDLGSRTLGDRGSSKLVLSFGHDVGVEFVDDEGVGFE